MIPPAGFWSCGDRCQPLTVPCDGVCQRTDQDSSEDCRGLSLILSLIIIIVSDFLVRTYLVGNTCYYGLTRQDCEREDFLNISCCSSSSLSRRIHPQRWRCGERGQSVKEPCSGECPPSTDKGYFIGSLLLLDYLLCGGKTQLFFSLQTKQGPPSSLE